MEVSKTSLELFLELLNQVSVRPMQQDADVVWERVKSARNELLMILQVPEAVGDNGLLPRPRELR